MEKKEISTKNLIRNIKELIHKNSSSFSELDIETLNQCVKKLEEFDEFQTNKNQKIIIEILQSLLRVFTNHELIDNLQDFFK